MLLIRILRPDNSDDNNGGYLMIFNTVMMVKVIKNRVMIDNVTTTMKRLARKKTKHSQL